MLFDIIALCLQSICVVGILIVPLFQFGQRLTRVETRIENGINVNLARLDNNVMNIFTKLDGLRCQTHDAKIAELDAKIAELERRMEE